ncbi:MAG: GNAT family acetyltransferase [Saprospiraceae bacterium]|nr:MAG: GNAT family acetyltransferase [Saprospiraceae bacterium]
MLPTLESDRLRLRMPQPDDLDHIYLLGSNPKVMKYINGGKPLSREEAKENLDKRISLSKDVLGYWITEEREYGQVIGWMALKALDETQEIELGYRFLEEAWGQGYATEGGFRLLDYAFKQLNLKRVVAVARVANKASIRVMEKLGMRYEKTGTFYNVTCVYYAINQQFYLENRK